ncbi:MAG TPA: hypothetical protein VFN08_08310, partial [Gemmatimonadales bacterium]|nr:hypothetical protein [Gemmatimonadales bacterium]
ELFYLADDSLVAAAVTLSPGFAVTGRRSLFTGSYLGRAAVRDYDVAPDDQHFVMISGGSSQSTLFGVQNLFERLVYERGQRR